jgi:hypothetical protein
MFGLVAGHIVSRFRRTVMSLSSGQAFVPWMVFKNRYFGNKCKLLGSGLR